MKPREPKNPAAEAVERYLAIHRAKAKSGELMPKKGKAK